MSKEKAKHSAILDFGGAPPILDFGGAPPLCSVFNCHIVLRLGFWALARGAPPSNKIRASPRTTMGETMPCVTLGGGACAFPKRCKTCGVNKPKRGTPGRTHCTHHTHHTHTTHHSRWQVCVQRLCTPYMHVTLCVVCFCRSCRNFTWERSSAQWCGFGSNSPGSQPTILKRQAQLVNGQMCTTHLSSLQIRRYFKVFLAHF
jgi:hypothetical protein